MKIYTSTILPILTYSLAIKFTLSKTQSLKLISFERRASSIIGKNVKSIQNTVKKRTLNFVQKCLKGEACVNFHNYFEFIQHEKCTRNNKHSLKLPKCKLEFGKKAFYYMGAKLFNDLPLLIRKEIDKVNFRKLVDGELCL